MTSILLRREFWGGLALVTAWLAVLFVGIFGGSIETSSAGGDASSVPVAVVVAIAALLATVSIGRWAFPKGEPTLPLPAEEKQQPVEIKAKPKGV